MYTFTAHAGDVLKISGAGCDAWIWLILSIVDLQGRDQWLDLSTMTASRCRRAAIIGS